MRTALLAAVLVVGAAGACGRTPVPLGDWDVPPGSDLAGQPPPGSDLAGPPVVPPGSDLSTPPGPVDMAQPPPVDMAQKSCGEVIQCAALQCQFQPQCLPMCVQGASPMTIQEVIALGTCAAQNCLQGQGGGGGGGQIDFPKLLICLTQKCSTQLAPCLPGF